MTFHIKKLKEQRLYKKPIAQKLILLCEIINLSEEDLKHSLLAIRIRNDIVHERVLNEHEHITMSNK
jgi:hypothetical protein